MSDFEIKQAVLSDGTYKAYLKAHYLDQKNLLAFLQGEEEFKWSENTIGFLFDFGNDAMRVCENLRRSTKSRKKKAREKIEDLQSCFGSLCGFMTFTFTNEHLANTSKLTRRRYIARNLKKIGFSYVANIDFGKKNGREHYHAVVGCRRKWTEEELKRLCKAEKRGYIAIRWLDYEKVEDASLIASYINKLSHHAVKDTANGRGMVERLIYSRNTEIMKGS